MALPGISITEADGKIFLRAQPDPNRGPLDSGAIAALLKETGHDGCAFDEVALAAATESCNTRLEPFLVQLGERHDAKITVSIAADEMSAEVTVTDAQGGKAISFEGLVEALTTAGVVIPIGVQ